MTGQRCSQPREELQALATTVKNLTSSLSIQEVPLAADSLLRHQGHFETASNVKTSAAAPKCFKSKSLQDIVTAGSSMTESKEAAEKGDSKQQLWINNGHSSLTQAWLLE
eukprot:CAMPEP_0172800062 /NCGR_PEP_ID=MMETSP1075-20121228/2312_1 /TAXON_ID=2916 /ORGANISM="Ceratium fusus, Strain PA161109" /LENGTH=109 /DNA_ID=CAMNT_0013637877 /DNA_START=19 /DNA_END=345 /DNA_ORIENTATION=-